MIDFKDKRNFGPSIAILLSIVALAVTLYFMVFVPKPSTEGLAKTYRDKGFQARLSTKETRERLAEVRTQNERLTWKVGPAQVGPMAMTRVNQAAQARRLDVVAFRPQRLGEAGELNTMPMLLTVSGGFPAVAAFVEDLENPELRLAVNLVQISAADGFSDRVTASIGLTALLKEESK